MLKQYPKTYENMFSSDATGLGHQKFDLNLVSIAGMKLDKYLSLSKQSVTSFYSMAFDESVRFAWLRRKFIWQGEKTVAQNKNSPNLCLAFSKFVRRNLGMETQLITRNILFQAIEPYLDEMFPGFEDGNPFENPEYYKFPFKNISIDFLPIVSRLDDRMELLRYADEQKMTYAVFADYMLNRIGSINKELGREKYIARERRWWYLFHIEDMDKKKKKT